MGLIRENNQWNKNQCNHHWLGGDKVKNRQIHDKPTQLVDREGPALHTHLPVPSPPQMHLERG